MGLDHSIGDLAEAQQLHSAFNPEADELRPLPELEQSLVNDSCNPLALTCLAVSRGKDILECHESARNPPDVLEQQVLVYDAGHLPGQQAGLEPGPEGVVSGKGWIAQDKPGQGAPHMRPERQSRDVGNRHSNASRMEAVRPFVVRAAPMDVRPSA